MIQWQLSFYRLADGMHIMSYSTDGGAIPIIPQKGATICFQGMLAGIVDQVEYNYGRFQDCVVKVYLS